MIHLATMNNDSISVDGVTTNFVSVVVRFIRCEIDEKYNLEVNDDTGILKVSVYKSINNPFSQELSEI